ncbi:MAG: ATP-dependent metallopeptidase FtsH/Yme1/Tma family protein, partial [Candidatus Tectomicrobia bacterium]|nr:ATP-dependent metallopeptidase FtsH/Yme1/Tma family protein [Candidatus Tectomicrobia bacterium]
MPKKKSRKQELSLMEMIKNKVNPNGSKASKRKKIPPKTNFAIWYFVLAFLFLTMIHNYFSSSGVETIPYSSFKQFVASGKVKDLKLSPELITGTLLKEEAGKTKEYSFVTIRVEDSELVKELDSQQILYSGTYESKWLITILSWVIPIVIFSLIWMAISRRMGGGAGVMSFGKSRAKIYAEDETKITFDDVAG